MTEWRAGLAGVTGEQIRHGLETWQEPWPPSLPEFRHACLGQSTGSDWEHSGEAYKRFPKALPKPKADIEVVQSEIAKMRDCLRKLP